MWIERVYYDFSESAIFTEATTESAPQDTTLWMHCSEFDANIFEFLFISTIL